MFRKDVSLFSSQAADGTSNNFQVIPGSHALMVYVSGDLGGGTLSLEIQNPDGEWIPARFGEFLEPEVVTIDSGPFTGRFVLSGSTTPDVTVWVNGLVKEIV